MLKRIKFIVLLLSLGLVSGCDNQREEVCDECTRAAAVARAKVELSVCKECVPAPPPVVSGDAIVVVSAKPVVERRRVYVPPPVAAVRVYESQQRARDLLPYARSGERDSD